jgi:hypothetical protein
MKLLYLTLLSLLLAAGGTEPLAAKDPANSSPTVSEPQLLPKEFGGWNLQAAPHKSDDPAVADPANAALLKEFGFKDLETAVYTSDDGRKLTVKAARFADATGAYGAFTYYKMPEMLVEKIGDQGASLNERVLFYRHNVLVDAVFTRLSAMSAAELRELAGDLPSPSIDAQKLPALPTYLPRTGYVKNSAKYVVGPAGLAGINAPLTASVVDFDAGAEVALGNYDSAGGPATLMLISYPTPQIAAAHLQRIEAAHQPSADQQANNPPLVDISPTFEKRTGPIVAIVSGPVSPSEAKSLLAMVNYDANVTWNENTAVTKKDNLANLLVNVIFLCGIILGLMLVAGFAFGGVRILLRRLLPQQVSGAPEETDIISLHLEERRPAEVESGVSSSIKAIYGRSNGH